MNKHVMKAVSTYFPNSTTVTSANSPSDSFSCSRPDLIPVRRIITEYLGAVELLPRDSDCIIDNGMEIFLYYGGAIRRALKWHRQVEAENEKKKASFDAKKKEREDKDGNDSSADSSEKKVQPLVDIPNVQSVVNVFIIRSYQSLLNTGLGIVYPCLFVPPSGTGVNISRTEKTSFIPDLGTVLPVRQFHPRFINIIPSTSSERYLLSRLPILNPTRQSRLNISNSKAVRSNERTSTSLTLNPDVCDSFDQYLYSISLMQVK
jgi:hypothetical protein